MNRFLIIVATMLLAAGSNANEPEGQVDFALFASALPIGEGAADPHPDDNEALLLQFWDSSCHSCSALMWDMDELVNRHDKVNYIAVSIDDDANAARTYVRKHRLFEKYRDRYFLDSQKMLSESLQVSTVPTILLVNAKGEVLVRKSGHLNAADLQTLVTGIREATDTSE